jgi:DNA-binding MarR family transcriptional regulator
MSAMEKVDVFDIIERMCALIRSEERRKCTELGIQAVHLQVLDYLSRCNHYSDTPAALTSYLGMTRGTVSQTLLLLERKGFIKKTIDEIDRRKLHLSLLVEGSEILKQTRTSDIFKQAALLSKEKDFLNNEEAFMQALVALQKANKSQSFGQCKTCKFFTIASEVFSCGLTKERLSLGDSEKICQEHCVI